MNPTSHYQDILNRLTEWANGNDVIDAVVLTGSRARREADQDAYSDLDIEIISEHVASLAEDDSWIDFLCSPITTLRLEPSADQRWPTRLIICENGCKVDFTLADRRRLDGMKSSGLDSVYCRGYEVLIDKIGICADLPDQAQSTRSALPGELDFRAAVAEFWFEAFHVPRYLARGELWLVKQRDWTMKALLLQMIEWHATATSKGKVDTWHLGRSISRWASPDINREIVTIFGRYEINDSIRAFEATTRVYARLGQDVAWRLGYAYPHDTQIKIQKLCDEVLAKVPQQITGQNRNDP